MAIEVKRLLTPDDVERMVRCGELDESSFWEFVNGEVVWMAPAFEPQGMIVMHIATKVVPFADSIGAYVSDGQAGYWVDHGYRQLRSPDFSLIAGERREMVRTDAFMRGAPDLAVEVLSKGQLGEACAVEKRDEYFAAGGKVVWIVNPGDKTVREYIAGGDEYRVYSGDAEITLDAIAPGFRCPISEFFRY
ncbi:MAG TPA: Uma2 family endonuclease [Chloroflexota bacterium]|nr:Uma2 family endonuclease [Chloroflexota bacterium]